MQFINNIYIAPYSPEDKSVGDLRLRWTTDSTFMRIKELILSKKQENPNEDFLAAFADSYPAITVCGRDFLDLRGLVLEDGEVDALDMSYAYLDYSIFTRIKFNKTRWQYSSLKNCIFNDCNICAVQASPSDWRDTVIKGGSIVGGWFMSSNVSSLRKSGVDEVSVNW